MQYNGFPDTNYPTTWSNGQGDIRFFTRADGSRLRYYIAGTGRDGSIRARSNVPPPLPHPFK